MSTDDDSPSVDANQQPLPAPSPSLAEPAGNVEKSKQQANDGDDDNVSAPIVDNRPKRPDAIRYDSATRNMALWRMVFFSIMMYEWSDDQVLTPFGRLDLEFDLISGSTGKDRWFAYNHLEWVQDLHHWLGQNSDWVPFLNQGGLVLCFLAAFGKELCIPGWRWYTSSFTILYLVQFLALATNFTNHNYLFSLLMILTIFGGGGRIFWRSKTTESERKSCQAAIVAMRAQLAIVYVFAALWKIHTDWFDGRIVRSIFLSFQQNNKARGIPWDAVEKVFPQVFVGLAVGGFLLDASMAMVLCLGKPSPKSVKLFLIFTLIFHLSTSISMAQMIGYSFPGTCIAALILFLPLTTQEQDSNIESYDKSLLSWLYEYAMSVAGLPGKIAPDDSPATGTVSPSRWQKQLVLLWVAWQLYMPLRMLVLSGGDFAYNRLGYRYSWTMMLHSLDYGIIRKHENGPDTVLLLSYYVPTCFLRDRDDMYLPRALYLGPKSEHPMQDGRTVPIHQILGNRESAMLNVFPMHLIARVGAGVARVVDASIGGGACDRIKDVPPEARPTDPRIGMHAVYFGRLNEKGPYSRLIDPTVDLLSVMEAQMNQTYATTIMNAFLDRRPDGNEFVLLRGVGSMRRTAARYEAELKLHYPKQSIEFIADRASCLAKRPLWLNPMGNRYTLVPLRLPFKTSLMLKYVDARSGTAEETREDLSLGNLSTVISTSLEIGIKGIVPDITKRCGETTEEDVLIAVLW